MAVADNMNGNVGLRLALAGKKTLTVGESDLVLFDPAFKKAGRNSCSPITCDLPGKRSIPLYNVLWAEVSNGAVVVDYVSGISKAKSKVKLEKWSLPLADKDVAADGTPPETFTAALVARAYAGSKPRRRAYVLVNPNAGPGHAVRRWRAEAKPLFDAARTGIDVVTLTRGGEATDLAEKVDIDKYDTIVACSGDGTPHEIFNGLAKRPDSKRALAEVAVSLIPCGSGNALSINVNGSNDVSRSALAIIKGVVTPLDLASITQGDRRIVSFLSQSLGIVAESDLGTENLRWMGGTRFTVGLLMRVSQRKCYPFDLALKVEAEGKDNVKALYARHNTSAGLDKISKDEDSDASSDGEKGLPTLKYGTVKDDLPESWEMVSYDKIGNFYCGNMAYMAPDAKFFAASRPSDGCWDLITVNGDLSPVKAARTLMAVESDKFFDDPNVTYKKISGYRIIPRNQEHGYISVDGEMVPFEPFQAEIHRGLGRVISKKGVYEATGPTNWEKVASK